MFRRERRSDTPPPIPVEQFRRDAKFTLPTATQGQSPLLTLPAEIQRMIFTELLGDQLVHVHLRHRDDKYEREGAPSKVSRWVHCVCCLERNTVPHYHEEKNHRWCFLSTNILRTCQSAYLQCLPVLYQTNTLSFRCFKDAVVFENLFVHFSSLVQSIDLYCTDCGCYTEPMCRLHEHSSWRMNLYHFDKYYHLFFATTGSSSKIRNSRLYFENDGSPFFYHHIKMLLLSTSLPLAQIQIFVPGDLDKRTDESVRVEASPDKRYRISIITHAKDPFSGCCGEIPDEEAEQHTDDNVEDNGLAVEESE
ncbi:hypothetical protein FLAG1_05414 [Fusarium langsethiae]|uniref:DUF7730 domain-containing protein n=1 Tax=Fusarium langsethiae TaxID=179993 RepID=A0A0N0DEV8_FUSLA|nr:hypothetical protein FLAG1_05414 [Fusarium langsethiae]GKU03062.1 unnamed protein product [Fusarium langsethiae]GKU18421.1 unnamed protein product [Fusarium langsethiae]